MVSSQSPRCLLILDDRIVQVRSGGSSTGIPDIANDVSRPDALTKLGHRATVLHVCVKAVSSRIPDNHGMAEIVVVSRIDDLAGRSRWNRSAGRSFEILARVKFLLASKRISSHAIVGAQPKCRSGIVRITHLATFVRSSIHPG